MYTNNNNLLADGDKLGRCDRRSFVFDVCLGEQSYFHVVYSVEHCTELSVLQDIKYYCKVFSKLRYQK